MKKNVTTTTHPVDTKAYDKLFCSKKSILDMTLLSVGIGMLCSLSDFTNIHVTLQAVLTKNPLFTAFIAIIASVVENFLPILIAEVINEVRGGERDKNTAATLICSMGAGFILLITFLIGLRWTTRGDLFASAANAGLIDMSTEQQLVQDTAAAPTAAQNVVAAFISVLPLCTSITCFVIQLLTGDPDRIAKKTKQKRRAFLEETIANLEAMLAGFPENGAGTFKKLDDLQYDSAKTRIETTSLLSQDACHEAFARWARDPDMVSHATEDELSMEECKRDFASILNQ